MISDRDDYFKFKMVNQLNLYGECGKTMNDDWFPNMTDNIIMFFHEYVNLYQIIVCSNKDQEEYDEKSTNVDKYKIKISNPKQHVTLVNNEFDYE